LVRALSPSLVGRRLIAPAALALTALVIFVIVLASQPGQYHVTAIFDQVNGLVPGADVEVAGTKVGSVDDIWLGSDGLPRVRLAIDRDYRLRRGAIANIRMFSVAGEVNRFVSLHAGSGPPLPDGSTLGLGRTDEPVEIGQVLSTLDPRTAANVRAVLAGLDFSTRSRGTDIAATLAHSAGALRNTAGLVREVTSDGQALRTLVHDGSAVVQALAQDPASIGATTDSLASLLGTTAARQAELTNTAALLAPGLTSPQRALARLDRSIVTLDALVRTAEPGVRALIPFSLALRPTLQAAAPALRELDAVVSRTPADLRALEPLLRALVPALRVLEPVLRSANPILDQLRVRLPDFFSFFSNWADFTSNYDANGHAARVGVVFPPAPLSAIGPSQDRAGSLLPPFLRTPGVLEGQPWTDYQSSFIGGGKQP
jgi:phospholipid/cholesterol/gamma-HCH transport system substrate-binding protein